MGSERVGGVLVFRDPEQGRLLALGARSRRAWSLSLEAPLLCCSKQEESSWRIIYELVFCLGARVGCDWYLARLVRRRRRKEIMGEMYHKGD
jgi:hypothetical protein